MSELIARLTMEIKTVVEEAINTELKPLNDEVARLQNEMIELRTKLREVANNCTDRADELEQYQRRNNLRFFGIKESKTEDTDALVLQLCRDKLGIEVPADAICRSHRVGKLPTQPTTDGSSRPWPIIVQWWATDTDREFSLQRKKLKGKMENGLKFNNRLISPKENTPLVFLHDKKLPLTQKLAYGLGHFYNDICAAIWFTYALIFLQLVAEMGPVNAGFLLFIGQAVDAVSTPVAGYLLDRTVNRKRWHLIGSLLVLFSFPLIFTTPASIVGGPVWIQMVYFSVSISVFQVGWAVVQIAHLSLLPELTTLTEERAQLTGHRYTASMAAHILVYFVAWAFLSSSHGMNMKLIGPSDSWRFLDLAILTSIIGLGATIVFHTTLKNTSRLLPRLPRKEEMLTLRAKSIEFFKSPHLYSVAVIYTSSRLFMTLSLVYIPLFINETVLSEVGALATVPLASFLVSAFAALIVKLCSENCGGLRSTYLVGSAFCLLGCILVHLSYTKSDDTTKVFGVAILFGAGSSITMVVSLCVTANLIGPDTECGALVYSVVTTADKLLNGLAVVIIEELKCDHVEDCPYYYGGVLSYVNAAVVFCGLAVLYTLPTKLFAATSSN